MTQSLQLNVIPFPVPVEEVTFYFYYTNNGDYNNFAPISINDIPKLVKGSIDKSKLSQGIWLYTDFHDQNNSGIELTIKLADCPYFALHYYRYLVRNYFLPIADIMHNNFTKEIEVWMKASEQSSDKYTTYHKFTLKLQHARLTDGPEIVLSFDGKSKVYNQSIEELSNFDPTHYNWVMYNNRLHRWKYLAPEIKNYLSAVHPLVNNSLKPLLDIAFDIPEFKNRYPKYENYIDSFFATYLHQESFISILDVSKGFFKPLDHQVSRVSLQSNELQYGTKTGTDPKKDFKYGKPFRPIPPPNNVRFFFIYQRNQKESAVKVLYNYLKDGYKNDKWPFPSLEKYISQPLNLDIEANIQFDSVETAFETVRQAIRVYQRKPDVKYCAIMINPVPKLESDPAKVNLYYRIKEILLQENIASQVIKAEHIVKNNKVNDNFNTFLPHIEIAMLAKLGGIPWRLNSPTTNELIVGVGAFYSQSRNERFIGSAICFNNEGIFKGFDCFKSKDNLSLAGSIREAVAKFIAVNYQATRLIIHFYKDVSKKEIKPIIDTLHTLGLNIPVIVITVNKTESAELLAFDTADKINFMPYSGTIIKVGNFEYLLFNNTRYDQSSVPKQKEYHFPIKLSFRCTAEGIIYNISEVTKMIDQVYQFSRMYWKSTDQQSLPVTVKYPSMVAEIFPHFKIDRPNDYMKENLWFL
jgi:hypothetical protein